MTATDAPAAEDLASGGAWRVLHVDLASGPPGDPPPAPALVVLWWRDLPLGQVPPAELATVRSARGWRLLVAKAVAPAVAARLRPGAVPTWLPGLQRPPGPDSEIAAAVADGHLLTGLDRSPVATVCPGSPDARGLSVVVCTRGRSETLGRTLAALAAQKAPPGEVVVVENGPPTGATRDVVDRFPGVRYVAEPRPGLSVARNTGLRHARGDLVAFTDDDAEPHPAWTGQLARVLTGPGAPLAVTGLVLPASLASDAARLFEFAMGGFSQGYLPRDHDAHWFRRLRWRSAPVWRVGAGANMAFHRRAFELVGGFDERLGAGAAGCSEDSELWYRLLARRQACRYEPAAVVSHHHRSDVGELRAQAASYIEGHVAALFAQFGRHRHPGDLGRAAGSLPLHLARRALREARDRAVRRRRPDPLVGAELRGYRRGLRYARLAARPEAAPVVASPDRPVRRAGRRAFLAANPYPHPLTEGFFFREKMRAIHRVTPGGRVRSVLEVGGGGSALTARLFPGARVVNVDLDGAYGARPALRASGTAFVQADATRLPFRHGAFDAATLFDVLEHIPDDAAAAAEARRVVRGGGALLASSPNERWRFPYHGALRSLCPRDVEVMAEWGHVRRGYRLDELDALVGTRHVAAASFLSPVTVVAHDLSFSRLRPRLRRLLVGALSPVTWLGYALHRPSGPGTETAAAWTLPEGDRAGRA